MLDDARRLFPLGGFVLAAMLIGTGALEAQERTVPSRRYDAAFVDFFDGDYRDALRMFQDAGRGAIKTPQSRWIDSICYETMVGECYYEMGRLGEAMEHYTAAVKLYVAFSDWMIRVQFPPRIQPRPVGRPIPWGASARRARLGQFRDSYLIGRGRIDQRTVVEHGGVIQQARLQPIRAQEIVRATTLAIRRRAALLGPVGEHDPLTAQLITSLARRPGPPNHWSEAWVDVQFGLALVAGGKVTQGILHLQRSVLAAGEFDHPLTSVALLELGRLALQSGDYPAAEKYFLEATYAAVQYPDYGVLEEAFRYATITHLVANRKGMYPPLARAIGWAKVERRRQLETSLLLAAAENHAVLGQTHEAGAMLEEARRVIGRRSMGSGRMGARLSYLGALVRFQQKKIAEGDAALAEAMKYMKHGSHWLFHIGLVDKLYTSGGVTARTALELYGDVLRDPTAEDWTLGPMESLAVLTHPHPLPIERWFEIAIEKRREHQRALEIADRARRHRFFSSLPFGGRLQSLRWILEGPPSALNELGQLQRRDLLARYPAFDRLSRQARTVRGRLEALPDGAADEASRQAKAQELAGLAAISAEQETLLREMAVRREPSELVFPPLRSADEIQKALPDGHAVLVFFATRRRLYGFLLNNQRYTYWPIGSPRGLNRQISGLLRQLGNFQKNHELSVEDLSEKKWKQSARGLLDAMLEGSQADFSEPLEELAIVPDGTLWYLPFEALQVEVGGELRPLIRQFRIRYAPLASLAVSGGLGRRPAENTAVVVGRLFPRDDESVAETAFAKLARVTPGAVALKTPWPGPSSIYAALFDRLVVLDDLNLAGKLPYRWSPMSLERKKAGNALRDWLTLPFGGPEEIILPGYHTAAEDGLKLRGAASGDEVFLSVCGLMSTGARTLLLSRWRAGGQSSYDLVREFVQELPHTSPADAWQRAVFVVTGSRLNLGAEPRLKRKATDAPPEATHPFFWAGYMLIDPGVAPKKRPAKADEPFLDFKKFQRPRPKPDEARRRSTPGKDHVGQARRPASFPIQLRSSIPWHA